MHTFAEQRGWHWALTSFVVDAWGEIESKTGTCTKGGIKVTS
jgi:hypothetical protein